ncbi:MAG: type II toxin-antitoxin system VapB family antitoxin [bacterium]|nr:type II toxin-antitoxin system VapB family antitoxin [bacterium]
MSRTNIDIDDELIAACMSRYDLPTKKSAVEFALRRLLSSASDTSAIYATAGVGWDGPGDSDEHAAGAPW